MKFLKTLKDSLTNIQSYELFTQEKLGSSIWFSLRFYLIFLVLLGILIFPLSTKVYEYIYHVYPTDLILQYKDQKIAIENGSLPLQLHTKPIAILGTVNILINEKDVNITINNVSTPLVYKDAFPENVSFTINKENVEKHGKSVILTFVITGYVFFCLFISISRTFTILVYTGLMFVFTRLSGKKVSYKTFFQLGMHVGVTAEIVNILYILLYQKTTFPMYDIAFTGIFVLVLWSLRKSLFP